jgi:hypothetical protein
MNPQAPRFFGLPKIHKTNVPIRPVVSSVSAPTRRLASHLNALFRKFTGFSPKYGVKNSTEFCRALSQRERPSSKHILVSFDVKNLFTNIPVSEAVDVAEKVLKNAGAEPPFLSEFVKLLKVCVDQNYFKFNDQFFQQTEGLAMGSPLSPLLADLYMDNFEQTLFNDSSVNTSFIDCWFRYVDDVFAVWTSTERQLDIFLSKLNSQCKNIQFTCEKERNNSLNFLDITILTTNKGYEFSIHRKETTTDHVIPSDSRHHPSQKMAAFHFMLNRLLNIPLSQYNFDKELNTVKTIAVNNGYNKSVIQKMLDKKRSIRAQKLLYGSFSKEEKKRWCKLLYHGVLTQSVANLFPKDKFNIAYYNKGNLRTLLSKTKDKIDRNDKSGIYKLKCNECMAVYVGQTGRAIKVRTEEHKRHWRNGQLEKSQFAKHLWECDHKSDFEPEMLHLEKKGRRMDSLEQMEIRRPRKEEHLVNENIFENHSPLLDVVFSLT